MQETDGHWPLARKVPELGDRTAICCECGQRPKRIATRFSMLHAWHQTHRRALKLVPLEYSWPGKMEGLSAGGPLQVRGLVWRDGDWARA
jgi:hypothetical protein